MSRFGELLGLKAPAPAAPAPAPEPVVEEAPAPEPVVELKAPAPYKSERKSLRRGSSK